MEIDENEENQTTAKSEREREKNIGSLFSIQF